MAGDPVAPSVTGGALAQMLVEFVLDADALPAPVLPLLRMAMHRVGIGRRQRAERCEQVAGLRQGAQTGCKALQLLQDGATAGLMLGRKIAHVVEQLVIGAAESVAQGHNQPLLVLRQLVHAKAHFLKLLSQARHVGKSPSSRICLQITMAFPVEKIFCPKSPPSSSAPHPVESATGQRSAQTRRLPERA